jgi:hypothetical protein
MDFSNSILISVATTLEVDPIYRTTGPGCLVGSVAVPIF